MTRILTYHQFGPKRYRPHFTNSAKSIEYFRIVEISQQNPTTVTYAAPFNKSSHFHQYLASSGEFQIIFDNVTHISM